VRHKKRQIFVTFPVDGKSSADELARRDPQLLVTSAIVWRCRSPLTHHHPKKFYPARRLLAQVLCQVRPGRAVDSVERLRPLRL
jgi:hypothetical protein